MSSSIKRSLLASGSASLLLCAAGGIASSQDAKPGATALPEIHVTAPSPIQRRHPVPSPRPVRIARLVPGRNRERARQPQPAPVAAPVTPAPQPGLLPVVPDQFAPIPVVPNEETRRQGGATLGDL